MKVTNFTIDNYFRNPFSWGVMPKSRGEIFILGFLWSRGEDMPANFSKRWLFVIYFGYKAKMWSNYSWDLKED